MAQRHGRGAGPSPSGSGRGARDGAGRGSRGAGGRSTAGRGAGGEAGRGAGDEAGRGAGGETGRGAAGRGAGGDTGRAADRRAPATDRGRADRTRRQAGGPGGPGGAPDQAAQRARLREVIEPVVAAAGYDLEGFTLSRAGRRHLVRLTVDGDGGVNLDAVADVSRRVSSALDAVEAGGEELFAGEYELEVSSPGVDRPLTLPRHWRRNVGRLVQVRVVDRQVTGRLLAADDDGIVLDVDGQHRELPHEALGSGKIQLEFTRLAALSDAELEDMLDPIGGDEIATPSGEDEQQEDEE
jgi:ribosome maturation factor RimP